MPDLDKDILEKFYTSQGKAYREELNNIVKDLAEKYRLQIRLGGAIYHREP